MLNYTQRARSLFIPRELARSQFARLINLFSNAAKLSEQERESITNSASTRISLKYESKQTHTQSFSSSRVKRAEKESIERKLELNEATIATAKAPFISAGNRVLCASGER